MDGRPGWGLSFAASVVAISAAMALQQRFLPASAAQGSDIEIVSADRDRQKLGALSRQG